MSAGTFLAWMSLARGSSQVIEIGLLGEWEVMKARPANDSCDMAGTALVGTLVPN